MSGKCKRTISPSVTTSDGKKGVVLRYYPIGRAFTAGGNQVIVEIASAQIGNNGGQPYWSWYGFKSRIAWCAGQCGYIDAGIIPKFSLCSDGVTWFKKNGQWQDRNYLPQAGDLIFFDWESDDRCNHVGIVEKCEDGVVYTIEELLDMIDNPALRQLLMDTDRLTLDMLFLKMQGYSVDDIAVELGKQTDAVYKRLSRIKKKIMLTIG